MRYSGRAGAWRPRRKPVSCWALLGVVLGLAVGCEDVAFNWAPEPQPAPRPAARPAGRVVAQGTEAAGSGASSPQASANGSGQSTTASPQTPDAPAATPSTAQPAAVSSPLQVYQLVLFSEAGPAEAPPGIKHIRLQNARARDVANVLSLLYLPSGPSGTDHRYTLVYPTPLESELAAEAARQLDVGIATEAPASQTAGDRWRWGIAQAFTILEDVSIGTEQVRSVAELLAACVSSSQLTRPQRWSAGMLAGELLAHRLYDYAAAVATYEQTAGVAEPGSYEQMATLYAQARALQQDGNRKDARPLLETLIGQFGAMRRSEVFVRTRETLAQWDRRTK